MELNERVARCETRIDNVEDRVDKQEKLIESIHKIATKQDTLSEKMDKVEYSLEEIKGKPSKNWDKVVGAIITGVVGVLVGAIMALVLL